ncbi:MAG: hypothetical protein IJ306_09780 [Oscillospiraceae bacterium]|nr:hypothetical protein [Oscillospiraceae bacterium]
MQNNLIKRLIFNKWLLYPESEILFAPASPDLTVIKNTIRDASLNVATSANGEKILYYIDPIKKVKPAGNSALSSPIDKVPQKSGNVNGQNNAQNNTPAFGRSYEEMRKKGNI